jgi:3-hydroxyisobutyrate dehydrogenase-like beta-hydroxyacid dehydrogenase
MDDKRAGFAGLGLMGGLMAANAARKGWQVSGWNRSADAAASLQDIG